MLNHLIKPIFIVIDIIKRIGYNIEKLGPDVAAPIYVIFATFFNTSMIVYNKLFLETMNITQMQIIRGVSMCIISYLISKKDYFDLCIQDRKVSSFTIFRCILATQFAIIYFFMVKWLPVSYMPILHMASPMIITILDSFINKVAFTIAEFSRSFISFFWVFLLIKPEIFYNYHQIEI